jgi:hypothetical protein
MDLKKFQRNFGGIRVRSGVTKCSKQSTFIKTKMISVTCLHYDNVGIACTLSHIQEFFEFSLSAMNSFALASADARKFALTGINGSSAGCSIRSGVSIDGNDGNETVSKYSSSVSKPSKSVATTLSSSERDVADIARSTLALAFFLNK